MTAANLDWTKLGAALRASALDAHGYLPSIDIAYAFLLDNPECFISAQCSRCNAREADFETSDGVATCAQCGTIEEAMNGTVAPDGEWPEDMPTEAPRGLIDAYFGAVVA